MNTQGNSPDLSLLAQNWPSPIVARSEVGRFSGGLLHARTLANHDAAGTGPRGKITVGRRVAYTVESLLKWMEGRAKVER